MSVRTIVTCANLVCGRERVTMYAGGQEAQDAASAELLHDSEVQVIAPTISATKIESVTRFSKVNRSRKSAHFATP